MRAAHGAPSDVRLPDNGVRALFTADARRQRYLDVEAALAAAQAECGLIPAAAARPANSHTPRPAPAERRAPAVRE